MFGFNMEKRMEQMRDNTCTGRYYVSTNDTPDAGLETMVFHLGLDGRVSDWAELDVARYDTVEEAKSGHQLMLDKWNKIDLSIDDDSIN